MPLTLDIRCTALDEAAFLLHPASEVLLHHRDQDLIQKITILKSYFELGQMLPEQDYGSIIRRAAWELDGALRRHSKRQVHSSTESATDLTDLHRSARKGERCKRAEAISI
jgi:hypothetical protein